jgi:hypothetical protein
MADSILQTTAYDGQGIRSLYPKELVSSLYADDYNNLCALEPSISGNESVISFPQNSSGSSNKFKFDSSSPFISQMFIQFQLTITNGSDDTSFIQFKSDYPAYHLIEDIRYQVSGTEEQIIRGETLVDYMSEIMQNDKKRDAFFELSGRQDLIRANGNNNNNKVLKLNLYAFLPLPWSDPRGHKIGMNTKPLPVYRCQNGFDVTIKLRPFSDVYDANAVANKITGTMALDSGYLFFKYHKVANPQMAKQIKLSYPFQTIRSSQILQYKQSGTGQTAGINTINLTSFPQGQCTNIIFRVTPYSDTNGANINTDIYKGVLIDKVKLLFNGKIVYNSDQGQDAMWDILSSNKKSNTCRRNYLSTGIYQPVIHESDGKRSTYPLATSAIMVDGYLSTGVTTLETAGYDPRSYYYVIPISETRLSELNQMGEFPLGGNLSKETLQLQFRTPTVIANANCNFNASYIYSGLYHFSENKEVTLSW